MIHWEKGGHIYTPPQNHRWIVSHAAVPTGYQQTNGNLRIYYGPRDVQGRTHTTFMDVNPQSPSEILSIHDESILPLGQLGTFDDSGVMPGCFVAHDGTLYFFYIGWNQSVTVPYRLAIGLAVSSDDGQTFDRFSTGPVLDRNPDDPCFVTTPYILLENGLWRMWYTSATKWMMVAHRLEAVYTIKYAESPDGINWQRNNITCIPYQYDGECIVRPCVIRQENHYCMWYAYRGSLNFRTDRMQSYRIGYAESPDGITWTRKDEEAGIDVSENGWDSQMVAYPHICTTNKHLLMLYNGNGFGKSGFGYAIGNP